MRYSNIREFSENHQEYSTSLTHVDNIIKVNAKVRNEITYIYHIGLPRPLSLHFLVQKKISNVSSQTENAMIVDRIDDNNIEVQKMVLLNFL